MGDMRVTDTRYSIKIVEKFWHQRTFLEKLLFWKTFTKQVYIPLSPGEDGYDEAQYQTVEFRSKAYCMKDLKKIV